MQTTGVYTVLLATCFLALCAALNTNEANKYRPIYKFDGSASSYCYPDTATSGNDGRCITSLNQRSPVYTQQKTCGSYTVFTYYLWYGKQKGCIALFDKGHGNDWERVSVFVQGGQVKKVVYHQHSGHYTRKRGKFEREGERPIVYIGKVAHGSYHHKCDGKCSFVEFFKYGCLGTVNYCQGGCGYWDDFRHPGPTLRDVQVVDLQPGTTISGISRPARDVCSVSDCKGSGSRTELFEGQILFTRHNNYLFVSHYKSGVNFWVAVRVSPRGRFYLDYQVRVPGIYRQKTRGLMGNLDRNSGNNFFKEYTLILIRREVLTI